MADYDLRILGAGEETSFVSRFDALLSDLLDDTPHAGRITLEGFTILNEGEEKIGSVCLCFDGGRTVTRDNFHIVDSFCIACMNPESDAKLSLVSKYGLLGFSAAENTFGNFWNLIAVSAMTADGAAILADQYTKKKLTFADKLPMWINVAGMIANTAIAQSFQFDSALYQATDVQKLFKATQKMMISAPSSSGGTVAQKFIDQFVDQTVAKCKTMPDSKRMSQANEAYNNFHDLSRSICGRIRQATAGNSQIITLWEQRQIYIEMYKLHECAHIVFSSTEALAKLYLEWFVERVADAGLRIVTAGFYACQSVATFRAALSLKNAAEMTMTNVQTENLLIQAGRTLKMVKTPTPMQIATAQASALTKQATMMKAAGIACTAMSALELGLGVKKSIEAGIFFKKKEACRKLNVHIYNTAVTILQIRVSLAWIHSVNGQVRFKGDARSEWETYLRTKYGNTPAQNFLSPEFVIEELRDTAYYLEQHRIKMQAEHSKIF